jgi:hypothetical protein
MTTFASPSLKSAAVVLLLSLSALLNGQGNLVEFPYNPDANGDDFVGTSDLLALLNLYGSEFSEEGLYLNEDTTEAVLYIGPRNYMDCVSECKQLPGNWGLPTMSQFPLVHEIVSADNYNFVLEEAGASSSYDFYVWTNQGYTPSNVRYEFYSEMWGYSYGSPAPLNYAIPAGLFEVLAIPITGMYYGIMYPASLIETSNPLESHCFCAVSQRPRVEYALCNHENEALFNQCVSEKLNTGWYPSGGTTKSAHGYASFLTQSFWRWAN